MAYVLPNVSLGGIRFVFPTWVGEPKTEEEQQQRTHTKITLLSDPNQNGKSKNRSLEFQARTLFYITPSKKKSLSNEKSI